MRVRPAAALALSTIRLERSSGDQLSRTDPVRPTAPHPVRSVVGMPDHDLDRAIDGLARRQHGAFHRDQAVRRGATRAKIRSRLSSGRWIRLLDSEVFALPSHPRTWLRQCSAATLAVPGGAVSGESAAALHGFDGVARSGIEVCTRHGTTHDSPFGHVRETHTVGRLTVIDRIRVISPADTVFQLAALLDVEALGSVLDAACRTRRDLLPELRDRYVALQRSRMPGIARLRAVLDQRGEGRPVPTSELNARLHRLLVDAGVHALVEVTPPWVQPGEQVVDAVIPSWRLILEGDGRTWHTQVRDFERDRERDAVALAHGYATLRFTWPQLVHRRVWCRNLLVAVGRDRSGQGGHMTTGSAGSTAALWVPGDRSGPGGRPATGSAGSIGGPNDGLASPGRGSGPGGRTAAA